MIIKIETIKIIKKNRITIKIFKDFYNFTIISTTKFNA